MLIIIIVVIAAMCVAFANGANDNFKGVATLFGSGTTNYRGALLWATATTFLGSLVAVLFASQLIKTFSGKGLVSDSLVTQPNYLAAVAFGSGLTVLFATRLGLPISTTHALVGGLVGAGLVADGGVNVATLGWKYLGPLLISPLLAIAITVVLHRIFHRLRLKMDVVEETCFCVGLESEPIAVVPHLTGEMALVEAKRLTASTGAEVTCQQRYGGQVVGVHAAALLDTLHYLSAGAVSFARGLNDTPKIAALLVAGASLSTVFSGCGVALVIALGGLLAARRVAETMSHKITPMNAGQGFTANVVTGLIVIGASRLGVPVSTTHVSCGGIFGVGAVTAEARWQMIRHIVLAWVLTLPVAAVIAAIAFSILRNV